MSCGCWRAAPARKLTSPKPSSRPTVMVRPQTWPGLSERRCESTHAPTHSPPRPRTSAECDEGMPPEVTSCLRSHFPSFILSQWAARGLSRQCMLPTSHPPHQRRARRATPVRDNLESLGHGKRHQRGCQRQVARQAARHFSPVHSELQCASKPPAVWLWTLRKYTVVARVTRWDRNVHWRTRLRRERR